MNAYGLGSVSLDVSAEDAEFTSETNLPVLYVETGGTVHFTGANGVEDTWTVADATHIPIRVRVVHSDSTATGIHAITV